MIFGIYLKMKIYDIEDYIFDFQKKTEFKKLNPNELVKV